jgi:lysozyme
VSQRVATGVGAGLILCSAALLAFLGRWEGEYELTVYADKLAAGLPTVCKGLTRHVTTTPIIVGEVWTAEKCKTEEERAVTAVQWELLRCYTRTPPQSVFDASTSHAWNFGSPATCGSAAMKAWNRGEWDKGCRRLWQSDDGRPVWSYVKTPNGYKFVRGLANRRAAERDLCNGNGKLKVLPTPIK